MLLLLSITPVRRRAQCPAYVARIAPRAGATHQSRGPVERVGRRPGRSAPRHNPHSHALSAGFIVGGGWSSRSDGGRDVHLARLVFDTRSRQVPIVATHRHRLLHTCGVDPHRGSVPHNGGRRRCRWPSRAASYFRIDGHGPAFRDERNRIGKELQLPRVRTANAQGTEQGVAR
jgi:hypothetical protein